MEMVLDKKKIRAIFSFKFKQQRQLVASTMYLAQELPGAVVLWWFKKFCKGDESLDYEEHSGQP